MTKDRIRNSLKYAGVMFASEVPASLVFFLSLQLICMIIGKYDFYDYREAIPLMLLSSLFSIVCALLPLTTVDILVFIGIYLLYFAVYELLLFRRYKKLRDSQISRLKGDLYERQKK